MFRTLTLAAASVLALGAPIAATAAPDGCPPGLSKKQDSCEAPGQAKKQNERKDEKKVEARHDDRHDDRDQAKHSKGDRVPDGYSRVSNPERYGLGRGTYYHRGGDVIRVDPDTQKILAVVGLIQALSN